MTNNIETKVNKKKNNNKTERGSIMKDMKYKIGDNVEVIDETIDEGYVGEHTNGKYRLRTILKDGSLGKISRGFDYIGVEGSRGEVLDIVGDKLIVGLLQKETFDDNPHPYLKSIRIEKLINGLDFSHYRYFEKGIECSPYKVELVDDDFEIKKLEEKINIKENEIEELKQQIETIKKEGK